MLHSNFGANHHIPEIFDTGLYQLLFIVLYLKNKGGTVETENKFSEIILLIKNGQAKAISAVNVEMINLYWNVGAYIKQRLHVEAWGKKTVDELAAFMQKNHPELKGFNRPGLYRMLQFFETYSSSELIASPYQKIRVAETSQEIVSPLVRQFEPSDIRTSKLVEISWTNHMVIFARCKSEQERTFYIEQSIIERYSKRELERQISAGLFERTVIGKIQLPKTADDQKPDLASVFKDSYIFEFLNLPESYNESDLQRNLIQQMKSFVLELGKDFLFIDQQYKLHVGNSDFYIDLLFFHRGLQCLVAFELKADKFKPEHMGQLNFYLEALDRNVKKPNENPSIGILLCKDKDNEVVEYAMSRSLSPTMVADYKMQLPDKKILESKLHEIFGRG